MPVYNAEKFLAESINSILSQTYSDFELLILDDGSTDNSLKIIKAYAKEDKRIKRSCKSKKSGRSKMSQSSSKNQQNRIYRMDGCR